MTASKKLILAALAPLLFAVLAGWQWTLAPSAQALAQQQAAIAHKIDDIQNALRNNPEQARQDSSVTDSSGKTYSLYEADVYLQKLPDFGWWQTVYVQARWALSALGFIAAMLATAITLSGLLWIRSMGRQAMASREALLRVFSLGRKALPWLSAASAFCLNVAAGACLGFETVRQVAHGWFDSDLSSQRNFVAAEAGLAIGLFLGAFWSARAIWRASRRLFRQTPLRVLGLRVGEQDAPALWAFVRDVAARAGADMPGQIVAGMDECFFVTENSVQLRDGEQLPAARTLYLPLPYLAFMTRAEAAAVIGHELGHFKGADTGYSQQFAAIYASALENLNAIDNRSGKPRAAHHGNKDHWMDKPFRVLGEFFLDTFERAVKHWHRERELAADRVGAAIGDARAIALSLLRIGLLAPHVGAVLAQQGHRASQDDMLRQVIARVRAAGLGDPRQHLEDRQPHPVDTHPTTRQRLQALDVPEDEALFRDAARPQCSDLLVSLGLARAADLGLAADDSAGEAAQNGTETSAASQSAAPSLTQRMERDFTQAARDERVKQVRALSALAGEGRETLALRQHVAARMIFVAVGSLLLLALTAAVGVALWFPAPDAQTPPSSNAWLGVVIFLALDGYLLFGLFKLWRFGRVPVMVLGEQGFSLGHRAQPIAWRAVEDVRATHTTVYGIASGVLTVTLLPGHDLCARPQTLPGTARRAKYFPQKRQLRIAMTGDMHGLRVEQLPIVFRTYWQASLARAQLAQWEDVPTAR